MPAGEERAGEDRAGEAEAEFAWRGHEEAVVYALAAVSYVALGVVVRTVVLNWIVGPLYFVVFVWAASLVVARRRAGR